MKLREIFRFEFMCQARRVRTWVCFAILFVVAYLLMNNSIEAARHGGPVLVNAPSVIAVNTVIAGQLWLLLATAVAGTAAARDVQTRMHPLVYTTPISKADYLGGRFMAAFVLNALILLAVPAGILLAVLLSQAEPGVRGPFRPAAYVSTYGLIALPTAFAVTAVQFSFAALSRRAVASYLGSVLLFVASVIGAAVVEQILLMPTLAKLVDPTAFSAVLSMLSVAWTPIEKNTRLVALEGSLLATRIAWIGIGLGVLAFTHYRFRFDDRTARPGWRRAARRRAAQYAQ
jgi:ABC-2 type transport system permease protein